MRFRLFSIVLLMAASVHLHAQFMAVGAKFDKELMFQATVNAPVLFDDDLPYDVSFGVDYTSKNELMPSGLQFQSTAMYFLDEGSSKSHLVYAGLTAGYLLDFNSRFTNQFRFTPHLYAELGFLMIKVGYDYLLPLQKGSPFISVGLGGGYLFRHFKLM